MRNVLILAMSTALTGCPAETQSTCSGGAVVNGRCAESACGEAGVRSDGYCNDDPERPVSMPPLRRLYTVETEKAIDGFGVEAKPDGVAGWTIRVTNETDAVATVVWDEGTFVTSGGQSAGRLISGETRKIDTAKAQPAMPVAPHANVTNFVIPEKFIGDEDIEQRFAKVGPVRARFYDRLLKAREERAALIVGGKLYVTIASGAGKQTWAGVVTKAESE